MEGATDVIYEIHDGNPALLDSVNRYRAITTVHRNLYYVKFLVIIYSY